MIKHVYTTATIYVHPQINTNTYVENLQGIKFDG